MTALLVLAAILLVGIAVVLADASRLNRACVNCGHIGYEHEHYDFIPAPCLRSGCSCHAFLPRCAAVHTAKDGAP